MDVVCDVSKHDLLYIILARNGMDLYEVPRLFLFDFVMGMMGIVV